MNRRVTRMRHARPGAGLLGCVMAVVFGISARAALAEVAAEAPLRIALVSDPHVSLDPKHAVWIAHFDQVIDQVNAAGVDRVLLAGDLTQGGRAADIEKFLEMAGRFDAPMLAVTGNHDVGAKPMPEKATSPASERVAAFTERVGPAFFVEMIAPQVRLVGLTGSLFGSGLPEEAAQWAFLERELSPETAMLPERVLVLMHYPLFVRDIDEPDDYFNVSRESRHRLRRLFEQAGVSVVLSGHLHRPREHRLGTMTLISAPAVSFGLPRDRQPVGWTLVTLFPEGRVESALQYLSP